MELGFGTLKYDIQEYPMTKAETQEGLYGIEVREIISDGADCVYASGVFDNLNDAKLKIVKNKKYGVEIVFVPNGKDVIRKTSETTYGNPFLHLGPNKSPEFGKYTYGGIADMNFASYGASQAKNKDNCMVQANFGNSIDIYYGGSIVQTDKDTEIDINLYRQMFNLAVEVENLKEGKVACTIGVGYAEASSYNGYVYTCDKDNPNLDVVLELPSMPWNSGFGYSAYTIENDGSPVTLKAYSDDYYKYWRTFGKSLQIVYINTENEVFKLIDEQLNFKRMTKYKVTFNLADYIDSVTGTIKTNIIDSSDWTEEQLKK